MAKAESCLPKLLAFEPTCGHACVPFSDFRSVGWLAGQPKPHSSAMLSHHVDNVSEDQDTHTSTKATLSHRPSSGHGSPGVGANTSLAVAAPGTPALTRSSTPGGRLRSAFALTADATFQRRGQQQRTSSSRGDGGGGGRDTAGLYLPGTIQSSVWSS